MTLLQLRILWQGLVISHPSYFNTAHLVVRPIFQYGSSFGTAHLSIQIIFHIPTAYRRIASVVQTCAVLVTLSVVEEDENGISVALNGQRRKRVIILLMRKICLWVCYHDSQVQSCSCLRLRMDVSGCTIAVHRNNAFWQMRTACLQLFDDLNDGFRCSLWLIVSYVV